MQILTIQFDYLEACHKNRKCIIIIQIWSHLYIQLFFCVVGHSKYKTKFNHYSQNNTNAKQAICGRADRNQSLKPRSIDTNIA